MPNKKKKEDKDGSSLIVSRVQREAQEARAAGKKIDTGNSIIRSRVLHDDVGEAGTEAPKAARTSAAKRTRSASPKPRTKRSRAVPTKHTTET